MSKNIQTVTQETDHGRLEPIGSDCLLRFAQRSVYVGRSFLVRRQVAIQLTLRI